MNRTKRIFELGIGSIGDLTVSSIRRLLAKCRDVAADGPLPKHYFLPALALSFALMVKAAVGATDIYQPTDTKKSGQPLSPPEALARIHVPPGFTVKLAAAEPDVRQPIAMCYDDRGRLWVAESYSYNGSDFMEERHDRIIILEDRDGDGIFETRCVFHDGLNRLTGLAFGFGGVWVTAPPALLFIPDRDRDDRPDGEPIVHLDGWTLKAEHNSANGLTWGPDGWLYGRHGIKEVSRPGRPGTPLDKRPEMSCGIWRYHPTRHVFEVVADGTINPWGLDFDENGQMFITTSVVDHLWHVVPGARFKRWPGSEILVHPHLYELIGPTNDHSHASRPKTGSGGLPEADFPGGHSHSDGMIYLGGRWPETYRGSMFMSNIHGHRVNQDRLIQSANGGRYVGTHAPDFLRADDPWFRAISLAYGPDGDVVMSDWSDNGECHDRDGVHRTSGRIYKITWGEPRPVAVDLSRASLEELVVHQFDRNEWFVRHARRLLQERAVAGEYFSAVHTELRRIFESRPTTTARLHALWTLYVTGGTDAVWLATLLQDNDEHVRHWVIRLLADSEPLTPAIAARLTQQAGMEKSWLVRMALASALSAVPPDANWELGAALARTTRIDDDENLNCLLWSGWHPAVATHVQESIALTSKLQAPRLSEWIARRLAEQAVQDPAIAARLLEAIGENAGRDVGKYLVKGVALGLENRDYAFPPKAAASLRKYYNDADAAVRGSALSVGAKLRDPDAFTQLRAVLRDSHASVETRTEALQSLAAVHPAWLPAELLSLVDRAELLESGLPALAAYDDSQIAPTLLAAYPKFGRAARSAAIDTLVSRDASLRLLLDALATGKINKKDVSHFQARQVAKSAAPALRERFQELWGQVSFSPDVLAAKMKTIRAAMTPDFLAAGDVQTGRALFEQRCAVCHTVFGKGGKLAPDLTGSGRKDLGYLITNIVDPNAEIPADWRLTVVTLTDGRVISGSMGGETGSSVVIHNADGTSTLARTSIKKVERLNTSLMPTGLLDDLSPEQIRNLFAFLMSDPVR